MKPQYNTGLKKIKLNVLFVLYQEVWYFSFRFWLENIFKSLSNIYSKWHRTPCSVAFPPPPRGHELGVMVLIFGAFDSSGLFTQNIFPEKIVWKTCPGGSPKWDRQIWKKNIFFTLNSNISWFLNDKSKIFSVLKNRDLK